MATNIDTTRTARAARPPRKDVLRSFDDARALREHFRTDAAFCRALGWRPDTGRRWLAADVSRPRRGHRALVGELLQLALAADAWVADPVQVGDWILAPQPELAERSPADVVKVLGSEGLTTMMRNFARIAPRTRVGEPELPSADALRTALASTLDSETMTRVDRAVRTPGADVDLSDFD